MHCSPSLLIQGKLDIKEFAALVNDAKRGFVLSEPAMDGSTAFHSGDAEFPKCLGAQAVPSVMQREALSVTTLPLDSRWPHHEQEQARLKLVRDELLRDGGRREQLLKKDAFWKDKNGEWVRKQLLREQASRRNAEQVSSHSLPAHALFAAQGELCDETY